MNSFLVNIEYWDHIDIYPLNTIDRLIQTRQVHLYTSAGVELVELEVEDIVSHLQHLVNLLETYDHYHIAFLTQRIPDRKRQFHLYCLVKERKMVLMESFKPEQKFPAARFSVEEPMLISAFEQYFEMLLDQISPISKDKRETIQWLQGKIDFLLRNG